VSGTLEAIYLPAEVFKVRVNRSPAEGLTGIEILVLRLVDAGIQTFDELQTFLGFGHRPLLRMLLDLWQRGHVAVEWSDNTIRLPRGMSAIVRDDAKLSRLRTAHLYPSVDELMVDRMTGIVLRLLKKPARVPPSRVAPPILEAGGFRRATMSQLVRALDTIPKTTAGDRPLFVREAYLDVNGGNPTGVAGTPRMFAAEVQVSIEPHTQRLLFEVEHPLDLGSVHRRRLGQALSADADARPDHPFYAHLRERAARRAHGRGRIDASTRVRQFRDRVHDLTTDVDPGYVSRRHDRFLSDARDLDALVREELASRARLTTIAGAQAIRDEIVRAVSSAQHQVLLAGPWVGYNFVRHLGEVLERLIRERHVTVVLMWGIQQGDELPESVIAAIERMRRGEPRGKIEFALKPARNHAKVVVVDGHTAVVGSHNFLAGHEADDKLELAVRIRPPEGSEDSGLVYRLLDWASRHLPDYGLARSLATSRRDLVDPERLVDEMEDATTPDPLARPPDRAPEIAGHHSTPELAASVTLWGREWRAYADSLEAALGGAGVAANLIDDSAHKSKLWYALEHAERWLLIASSRATPLVVEDGFLRAIETLLEKGVQVALVYDHLTGDDARCGLRRLEGRTPKPGEGRLQLVPAEGQHAKVLAWEGGAVVSSFNFLSFAGDYAGLNARSVRRELGVYLATETFADDVLDGMISMAPALRAFRDRRPPIPERPAYETATPATRELSEMMRSLMEAGIEPHARRDEIRRCLSRSVDPWAVLQLASELPQPPRETDIDICAAYCIARARPPEDSATKTRWVARLARRAWERGDATTAAILVKGLPEGTHDAPPGWLADLVALEDGTAATADRLLGAALAAEHDPVLLSGVMAVAMHTLLFGAQGLGAQLEGVALEVLGTFAGSCPAPVPAWAAATRTYWGDVGRPLPSEGLRAILEYREALEAGQAARDALTAGFAKADRAGHNLPHTYNELYGPADNALLRPLRLAAANGDVPTARAFVKAWGPRPGKKLMHKAFRRAKLDHPDLSTPRGTIITAWREHINDLDAAARLWVTATEEVESLDPETLIYAAHLDAALALGATLHAGMDALGELTPRTGAAAPLLDRLARAATAVAKAAAATDEPDTAP